MLEVGFSFYDNNDVPQDAISGGNAAAAANAPCVPVNSPCNTGISSLASYNDIPANRKQNIYSNAVPKDANTIRRMPDGGS